MWRSLNRCLCFWWAACVKSAAGISSGWLRDGKNLILGVMAGIVLVLYGVIPTLQPAAFNFGRVYAAYGGIFVVLSILWG